MTGICKGIIHNDYGVGHHQCSNKSIRNSDWCGIHHPSAVARRKAKSDARVEKYLAESRAAVKAADLRNSRARSFTILERALIHIKDQEGCAISEMVVKDINRALAKARRA